MASRKKGKQNRKPTKKKLTVAQIREREWETAYNKAKKAFEKAKEQGFIDPKHKFSNEKGEFFRKKPKRITKQSVEAIKKWNLTYIKTGMEYVRPDTAEIVSGKQGISYQRQQTAKARKKQKEEPQEAPMLPPPNYDILTTIDNMINNLPGYIYTGKKSVYWLDDDKEKMHKTMWEIFESQEDENGEREYLSYLESHLSELEGFFEGIERDSKTSVIQTRLGAALAVISRGNSTKQQQSTPNYY